MNPRYRHVDFSRVFGLFDELKAAGYTADALQRLQAEYPRELADLRRQARLCPMPVDGDRMRGRKLGYFETTLEDGTLGYFQRRTDDCLQASVASLVQMPMDQVPDSQIDKQLANGCSPKDVASAMTEQFIEWSAKHGYAIMKYAEPPTWAKRWIGVVFGGDANPFHDHCLIMSGSGCLWDTSRWLPPTKREPITNQSLEEIDYGIVIERNV